MMEKYIRGEITNKALERRILELNLEYKSTVSEEKH
jgi:hypothetical protein